MGIAYSPPDKVVHYDIDAGSSSCLRAGLHAAVLKAGWETDAAIENGYVYLLTSPQDGSLQCKVRIQDTGRTLLWGVVTIDITFLSADETYESPAFLLFYTPGRRLRVHVTPCQIFTYRAGITDQTGNSIMGGIPYIDPNALTGGEHCADEDNALKTLQAWWVCGDLDTIRYSGGTLTFRNAWTAGSNATLHNDDLTVQGSASQEESLLRLLPPNKPIRFQYSFGNINAWYPVMMRWMGTEEPLCLDPHLAWNTEHPVKLRGQLWDAFVRTQHVPPEDPLIFEDLPWFAYSSNPREGSPHWYQATDIATVYLRDPGVTVIECGEEEPPPPSGLSNYAY